MHRGSYHKDNDKGEYLVVIKNESDGYDTTPSRKKNTIKLLYQSGTTITETRSKILDRDIQPTFLVTTVERQTTRDLTPEQKIEAFKTEFDIE